MATTAQSCGIRNALALPGRRTREDATPDGTRPPFAMLMPLARPSLEGYTTRASRRATTGTVTARGRVRHGYSKEPEMEAAMMVFGSCLAVSCLAGCLCVAA